MFTIYILYSHKDHKLYVGCTSSLPERLKDHQYGKVDATKYRRPLECIHEEHYENATDAYARERYLKSLWSGRFKKKLREEFESRLKP